MQLLTRPTCPTTVRPPMARPVGSCAPAPLPPAIGRDWANQVHTAKTAQQAAATATGRAQASAPPVPARELALLSNDVYNDRATPPPGWREARDAELEAFGIDPTMLSHPTGFRARVYVDTRPGMNGRLVVAFRGTSTGEDWITDARQAAGLPTLSYRMANDLAKQLQDAPRAVTMTGHSLGGGLASAAALAAGRPAATFNAAGLSSNTIALADATRGQTGRPRPAVDAYFLRGEILSVLQDGGDRMAARLLGTLAGGAFGGPLGARIGAVLGGRVDAPEAYGRRIAVNPVAPPDANPRLPDLIERHQRNWVVSSMNAHPR